MHFALPPDDNLVVLRIVHDRERGVFFGELGECGTELHVILTLFRLDRGGEHECSRRLLARRQGVAGLCTVELAERDRFAGGGLWPFLEMLTHQLENTRDT